MGFALAKTITDRFPGVNLYVCDVSTDRLTLFEKQLPHVQPAEGPRELAEASEVVFLSANSSIDGCYITRYAGGAEFYSRGLFGTSPCTVSNNIMVGGGLGGDV